MSNSDVKPPSWRTIAEQASKEKDPDKTLELAENLIRALDAESRARMREVKPDDKSENAA